MTVHPARPSIARAGDLVRIRWVALRPDERPASLPPETRAVPLVVHVNGFLESEKAEIGDRVAVRTAIGRRLMGELVTVAPRVDHDFGDPQPELMRAGDQLRRIL